MIEKIAIATVTENELKSSDPIRITLNLCIKGSSTPIDGYTVTITHSKE